MPASARVRILSTSFAAYICMPLACGLALCDMNCPQPFAVEKGCARADLPIVPRPATILNLCSFCASGLEVVRTVSGLNGLSSISKVRPLLPLIVPPLTKAVRLLLESNPGGQPRFHRLSAIALPGCVLPRKPNGFSTTHDTTILHARTLPRAPPLKDATRSRAYRNRGPSNG